MKKLLLIEDDQRIVNFMSKLTCKLGYEVTAPQDLTEGFTLLKSKEFDIVIVEAHPVEKIGLLGSWLNGEGEGESRGRSYLPIFINHILRMHHIPEFIIVARGGFPAEARFAADKGAIDYIQIPKQRNENGDLVTDLLRFEERLSSSLQRASAIADRSQFEKLDLEGTIGSSWKIRRALLALAQAAESDFNVLITGETGTGKKIFAKKIHDNSSRKNQDFVIVDCNSLQFLETSSSYLDDLFLSQKHDGITAGTILFHEIGYLPIGLQGKLLTLLHTNWQTTAKNSVGPKPIYRIISTSSKNLRDLLAVNQFREDLYYELSTFDFRMPPLRERLEDIPLIAAYHIDKLRNKLKKDDLINMSQDFIAALKGYSWPGNITELINVLTVAISDAADGQVLSPAFLPKKIQSQSARTVFNSSTPMDDKTIEDVFAMINEPGVKIPIERIKDAAGIKTEQNEKVDTKEKQRFCFYVSGDFWVIGRPKKYTMLKHLNGFKFIHFLLQHPNRFFSPLDVYHMRSSETSKDSVLKELAELNDRKYQDLAIEKLDDKTRKTIEFYIKDLKEKVAIQNYKDPFEATADKNKIKQLTKILKSGVERDAKSSHERARTSITKAIGLALKKIHQQVPDLKQYLSRSTINTGDKMAYRPILDNEPLWILFQKEHS